jgi:hypothetical protein
MPPVSSTCQCWFRPRSADEQASPTTLLSATVQADRDSPLAVNAPRSARARRRSTGRAFTLVVDGLEPAQVLLHKRCSNCAHDRLNLRQAVTATLNAPVASVAQAGMAVACRGVNGPQDEDPRLGRRLAHQLPPRVITAAAAGGPGSRTPDGRRRPRPGTAAGRRRRTRPARLAAPGSVPAGRRHQRRSRTESTALQPGGTPRRNGTRSWGLRRSLPGLGDRCGDVGAGGLDHNRGLDAGARIAGLPALPQGGAQPPGSTRPWRGGLAAAGLHNSGCGDHGPRRGRPSLVGVRAAVLEAGWGSGGCGCWRRRILPALLPIPGPSSPEHTFGEDNRSRSVRLKRSAGHEAGGDDYGERRR